LSVLSSTILRQGPPPRLAQPSEIQGSTERIEGCLPPGLASPAACLKIRAARECGLIGCYPDQAKVRSRLEIIMWVRVGSFLVKAGQATTLRRTYNEQAVPKVRAHPGNLGCLLLEPNVESEPFLKYHGSSVAGAG